MGNQKVTNEGWEINVVQLVNRSYIYREHLFAEPEGRNAFFE